MNPSVQKDVSILEIAQETFPHQYDIVLTYIDKDGNETIGLSPMLKEHYPILLVNKNGDNLFIKDGKIDFKECSEFAWAEESWNNLKEDIALLNKKGAEEGTAWTAFQQQNGVLAICETGEARTASESILGARGDSVYKASQIVQGSALAKAPVIGVNASGFSKTTLLHELTHNLSHTIHDFENTDVFNVALQADFAKGSSTLTSLYNTIDNAIQKGFYTAEQFNSEMFARLHEEKIKDPQKFAKEIPTMNAFYEHVVYPTVWAHTQGYTDARQEMDDVLKPSITLQQQTQQLKDANQENAKLKDIEKNAGWVALPTGGKQRDGKNPEVIAALNAEKKQSDYKERLGDHFSSTLMDYFKTCHELAKDCEKSDKNKISEQLKKLDTHHNTLGAEKEQAQPRPSTPLDKLRQRDSVTTPPSRPEPPRVQTRNNTKEAWGKVGNLYPQATK